VGPVQLLASWLVCGSNEDADHAVRSSQQLVSLISPVKQVPILVFEVV